MIDDPDGLWREGNGRKRKLNLVLEWKKEHPGVENKSLCSKETGLDRKTVTKWWNGDVIVDNEMKQKKTKENIIVYAAKLFAPDSTYTIDGYSHEEVVEAVTTGRWKQLGWELAL